MARRRVKRLSNFLGLILLVAGVGGLAAPARAEAILLTRFPLPTPGGGPRGITAGPDGNLWFAGSGGGGSRIGRITADGIITEFPLPNPNSAPVQITTGPDGNLWFTEVSANKIGRITPAGVITEFPLPTPQSGPRGITAGPDGALWFTQSNADKIGRITPGGAITEFPLPTPGSFPSGIAAGPDGNLWFTEQFGGAIGRITPAGVITEFPLPTGEAPGAITVGPDAALWFTEMLETPALVTIAGLGRITTDGVMIEFPLPPFCCAIADLTTGPDGALWFTETSHNIGRMTPAGLFSKFPLPNFGFACPRGMTTGPDGNLWVTEQCGNAISRIAITDLLSLSPASGVYVTTQRFDPTAILAPGPVLVGGQVLLDDGDVTEIFLACGIAGTLATGGQTLRCPLMGSLGAGLHTAAVSLDLADGTTLIGAVTWELLANTEP